MHENALLGCIEEAGRDDIAIASNRGSDGPETTFEDLETLLGEACLAVSRGHSRQRLCS